MRSVSDHVLLVEDDLGDILLTRRAVERSDLDVMLHAVQSGEEALDFLHRRDAFVDAPQPRLVILDLHMRGMSGLEVLQAIKSDPALSSIPVVVFTTSHADADVAAVYQAKANSYVCKPVGLSRVIREIIHYFVYVALPPV